MNFVERLVQRFLVKAGDAAKVAAGDFVALRPAHVMTHDNTAPVISKFKAMGAQRIADARQPVFALDHNVQDKSAGNLQKYASIEKFAAQHGIDFFPAGRGIGHQVMVEEGYAFPGTLVVASDSHSNMYGGVGCLGTPVVRTDAASIWATSQTWWQVPPVARVVLEGRLPAGVTGKDLIIALCGHFNKDEVLNHAVEFTGPGAAALPVEERLTIANMTTEWGALAGVFPVDDVTVAWLRARSDFLAKRGPAGVVSDPRSAGSAGSAAGSAAGYRHPRVNSDSIAQLLRDAPQADRGARYAKTLRMDLSSVSPCVSGPNHVKVMTPVSELERKGVPIHKAYIVSCVNSRVQDLAEAAAVVRAAEKKQQPGQGRVRVAEGVKLYIAPASSEVQRESERRGDWATLVAAGAIELPAGCGPCIGLGTGLLEDGEVGISATNRNFKGRMGSPKAQAYLASPAVVTASALAGRVASPLPLLGHGDQKLAAAVKASIDADGKAGADTEESAARSLEPLVKGFPWSLEGGVLFCDADNINTDGIYPGAYTYRDDIKPAEMARVAMENYDAKFGQVARAGDILVAGFNFGTGSSREQAATALKHKGIAAVVAGSFSTTYTRNAFNNGFLVLESPALVRHLRAERQKAKAGGPTVRVAERARVDLARWEIVLPAAGSGAGAGSAELRFAMRPVGGAAQELVVQGGLEAWVIANMVK